MALKVILGVVAAGLVVLDWITWAHLKRHLAYQGASRYQRGRDLGWARAELYTPTGLPLLHRLRVIFVAELVAWVLFIVVTLD